MGKAKVKKEDIAKAWREKWQSCAKQQVALHMANDSLIKKEQCSRAAGPIKCYKINISKGGTFVLENPKRQ